MWQLLHPDFAVFMMKGIHHLILAASLRPSVDGVNWQYCGTRPFCCIAAFAIIIIIITMQLLTYLQLCT
jgi:hypothetical protein